MSQSTESKISKWFGAKVIPGNQYGRVLGYPTINIDNPGLLKGNKAGVYASYVKISGKQYKGVLYFGPRLILGEKENILEIFILDFDDDVYGKTVLFTLRQFLRPARNFKNPDQFKKQLSLDCQKADKILQ